MLSPGTPLGKSSGTAWHTHSPQRLSSGSGDTKDVYRERRKFPSVCRESAPVLTCHLNVTHNWIVFHEDGTDPLPRVRIKSPFSRRVRGFALHISRHRDESPASLKDRDESPT